MRTLKIIAYVLWLPAGCVLAMAGVSPSDASSNLKAWLDFFGIEGIGDAWTGATDIHVMYVAGFVLACPFVWIIWDVVSKRLARGTSLLPVGSQRMSAAPIPTIWISRSEALKTLGRSSLVRLRVPNDATLLDALSRHLGDTYKTPGETRADELKRKLLRDFETQYPNGILDDLYGKEPLEWWIDERSDQTNP